MKFQCDRCKTRYTISDEKVRGKLLKIRCKTCQDVITLRGSAEALAAAAPPRDLTPPPLDPGPTRRVMAPSAPAGSSADEWYLAKDGAQEGPFHLVEAQRWLAARKPGEEIYAWRDDFTEWKPVERVIELAGHLPRPTVAPSATVPLPLVEYSDVAAPSVRENAPPAAVGVGGLISRASDNASPSPAPASAREPSASPAVAGVGGPISHGSDNPPPAKDEGVRDLLDFRLTDVSAVVRLPAAARPASNRPPSLSGSSFAMPARRSHAGLYLALGSVVAAAGVILAIALVSSSGDEPLRPQAAEAPASEVVANFYKGGHVPGADTPAAISAAPPAAGEPTTSPSSPPPVAEPASRAPASRAARPYAAPVAAAKPTAESPAAPTVPDDTGKADTFAEPALRLAPLTPDDVRDVYNANQVGLKRCYERALKQDPSLQVSSLDVTVTIGAGGAVQKVVIPDLDSALGACVNASIHNWTFRRSTDGLTTEFQIYFAKR